MIPLTPAAPRHPLAELLAGYGAVFKAAWQQRDELAGPRPLADEQAFLPAALRQQETPVQPAPRRAAYVICALFAMALAWAVLGRIGIVAVAQGRVVVSQRSKLFQPHDRLNQARLQASQLAEEAAKVTQRTRLISDASKLPKYSHRAWQSWVRRQGCFVPNGTSNPFTLSMKCHH